MKHTFSVGLVSIVTLCAIAFGQGEPVDLRRKVDDCASAKAHLRNHPTASLVYTSAKINEMDCTTALLTARIYGYKTATERERERQYERERREHERRLQLEHERRLRELVRASQSEEERRLSKAGKAQSELGLNSAQQIAGGLHSSAQSVATGTASPIQSVQTAVGNAAGSAPLGEFGYKNITGDIGESILDMLHGGGADTGVTPDGYYGGHPGVYHSSPAEDLRGSWSPYQPGIPTEDLRRTQRFNQRLVDSTQFLTPGSSTSDFNAAFQQQMNAIKEYTGSGGFSESPPMLDWNAPGSTTPAPPSLYRRQLQRQLEADRARRENAIRRERVEQEIRQREWERRQRQVQEEQRRVLEGLRRTAEQLPRVHIPMFDSVAAGLRLEALSTRWVPSERVSSSTNGAGQSAGQIDTESLLQRYRSSERVQDTLREESGSSSEQPASEKGSENPKKPLLERYRVGRKD